MRFVRKFALSALAVGCACLGWMLLHRADAPWRPENPVTQTPAPVAQPAAPTQIAAPVEPATEPLPEPAAPPTTGGQGFVSEWTGRPPAVLWDVAREQAREGAPRATRIPLRLSAARTGTLVVDRFEPTEEDGGVFSGELEGFPGSTVIMSYVGRAQSGVVLLPAEHRSYNFRAGDDGILRVTELDTLHAPGCGDTPMIGGTH